MIGKCLGALTIAGALALPAGLADGAAVISLSTHYPHFDDDQAGATAGPFLDPDTGVWGTITTTQILDSSGNPGGTLDFRDTQSGINNTSISGAERWTFKWNVDTQFLRIDFSSVADAALVGIQSDAWIDADITPGVSAVSFDKTTGTFTMDGTLSGDTLSPDRWWGNSVIPVIPAGTEISIFSPNGDSFSIGAGFTFALLVPEPASTAMLAMGLAPLALRRRVG